MQDLSAHRIDIGPPSATRRPQLRLVHLYPDLMSLYGDRGNIISLERRCAWRGIELEVVNVSLGERIDPKATDILFFGGGQDREQVSVSRDLQDGLGSA